MKKIFLTTMALQKISAAYKLSDKTNITYDEFIYNPISVTFAENAKKEDKIKICVVWIKNNNDSNAIDTFNHNYNNLQKEINKLNTQIGADITYEILETNFMETKDVFGQQFMRLFDVLENDIKIYADVTFGLKPFPFITLNILSFAEKFYDADIEALIYGLTSFKKDEIGRFIKDEKGNNIPDSDQTRVCDISALYYLNNITTYMDADNGEDAKEMLSRFFGL